MEPNYPIFVIATDDRTVNKFDSWDKLKNWYEQIDIEAGLYEGWDVHGYPFKLIWDKSSSSPKIELSRGKSEIDQLRNAIIEYARFSRTKEVFNYSGDMDNVIELYKSVEDHLKQDKFWYKISKKFKNPWRK